MTETQTTWRFPRVFWTANAVELCERAAYYGTFIAVRTYLLQVVKLGDVEAGFVGALFACLIYLFPFFTGALADRMGFRAGLALAFSLLSAGYGLLGLASTLAAGTGEIPGVGLLPMVLFSLFLIVVGGAFVKPVITGTVSLSSDETNRARAFSIFYMVVNIGAFMGKTIVAPIRIELGVGTVPYFSSVMSVVALLLVLLFYRPRTNLDARPRSVAETLQGMAAALSNMRFLALILITAGFWAIQGQLYASMPDYVLRVVGPEAKPEWLANVNPLVVVLLVVFITQLVRKWQPEWSIGVAMLLIPLSALCMAFSRFFSSHVSFLGFDWHPVTVMMVVGIAIQGLAECFLSPKYLEFASKQAPPGREGLYLGYAHLSTFFAWLFGFIFAGYLLKWFCPEPSTLSEADQAQRLEALAGRGEMPAVYDNAHYLWYAFALVGVICFLALVVLILVTHHNDARRKREA